MMRYKMVQTDLFLTHDWGADEKGRDNHKRVTVVNEELKKLGYRTWFDSDRMVGDIAEQMSAGIENTQAVIVFLTKRYMSKVNGDNPLDNCKLEFMHAVRRKTNNRMLCVVMEDRMKDTLTWVGSVGMFLGGKIYINMAKDFSDKKFLKEQLTLMEKEIQSMGIYPTKKNIPQPQVQSEASISIEKLNISSGETPKLAGTVWDWYHDGKNKNGRLTLTRDERVKWNDGEPQGSWSVNDDIVTTTFNGVFHRLKLDGTGAAVLFEPKRSPPSKMIKNGNPQLSNNNQPYAPKNVAAPTGDLVGSTWDWYHDGTNVNGRITLTKDGKVRWCDGKPHGNWSINNDVITTTFNGVHHKLKLWPSGVAVLLEPQRKPPSKMTRKDEVSSIFVGEYECHLYDGTKNKNTWHYVTIKADSVPGQYKWKNRAGVEWTLYQNDGETLRVGKDCPYYKDGHTLAKFTTAGVYGPWNEFYKRKV